MRAITVHYVLFFLEERRKAFVTYKISLTQWGSTNIPVSAGRLIFLLSLVLAVSHVALYMAEVNSCDVFEHWWYNEGSVRNHARNVIKNDMYFLNKKLFFKKYCLHTQVYLMHYLKNKHQHNFFEFKKKRGKTQLELRSARATSVISWQTFQLASIFSLPHIRNSTQFDIILPGVSEMNI